MAARSRAASRRSRCAAMTASPSATRPSRALREIWNGAALPGIPRGAAERPAATPPAPAAGCAGACDAEVAAAGRRRHPDPQRGGGDRPALLAAIPREAVDRDHRRRQRQQRPHGRARQRRRRRRRQPSASAATGAPAGPAPRRRPIATSSCFSMATAATARRLIPLLVAPIAEGRARFCDRLARARRARERAA